MMHYGGTTLTGKFSLALFNFCKDISTQELFCRSSILQGTKNLSQGTEYYQLCVLTISF